MTRKEMALRKKFGLATTTKALQNKDGVVHGPEDFVFSGRPRIEKEYFNQFGVFKSWENITFTVNTRGKVIVKR